MGNCPSLANKTKAFIPNLWNVARAISLFQKGTYLVWVSSCAAMVPEIAAGPVADSLGVTTTHSRVGGLRKYRELGLKAWCSPHGTYPTPGLVLPLSYVLFNIINLLIVLRKGGGYKDQSCLENKGLKNS